MASFARSLLLALLLPSIASAQTVTAVDVSNLKEGESLIVSNKGGVISVRPLKLLGATPSPNPTPTPGPLTPFQAEVQRLTKAALDKGGTATTGAAVSAVYSLAADAIDKDKLDVALAADAVRRGTDTVVLAQREAPAWVEFAAAMDGTITTLRAKGDLKTKAQFAAVFRDVATGMDSATGFKGNASEVVKMDPAKAGILGNIDLAKLIELIKLIMELFKLFTP